MSILNKYNNTATFDYDSEKERTFTTLKELYATNPEDTQFVVEALFINDKSHFGKAPVAVVGDCMVNFPQHLTDAVEDMRSNSDIVNLVNNHKVAFTIYEYKNKFGKAYGITWVELK